MPKDIAVGVSEFNTKGEDFIKKIFHSFEITDSLPCCITILKEVLNTDRNLA